MIKLDLQYIAYLKLNKREENAYIWHEPRPATTRKVFFGLITKTIEARPGCWLRDYHDYETDYYDSRICNDSSILDHNSYGIETDKYGNKTCFRKSHLTACLINKQEFGKFFDSDAEALDYIEEIETKSGKKLYEV